MPPTPYSTQPVVNYVLQQLKQTSSRPLVVGLSGPQGSGKSTVVKAVAKELTNQHQLNVVEFSLDDVYLTHSELEQVAKSGNSLLQKRGLPGTHSVDLCLETLRSLINQKPTSVPQYDKSAYSGEGDRSTETISVSPRYDVVLFEGWCVGFRPLSESHVERIWSESNGPLKKHSLDSVQSVNRHLERYQEIWDTFHALVHLDAQDISYVYKWRLQQEHQMIQEKGSGMTDSQVRAFVDGYMPAYELYNDGLRRYAGRTLNLKLNENRQPTKETKI